MKKTAIKDIDTIKDVGEKKIKKDLVKPQRTDKKKPNTKRNILKENKNDFKDTIYDKDLKASERRQSIVRKLERMAKQIWKES